MQDSRAVRCRDPVILRVPIPRGRGNHLVPVLIDPLRDDLLALLDSLHPDNREYQIRGVENDARYYFWDGWEGTHDSVAAGLARHLGVPAGLRHRITVWRCRRDVLHCSFDSPSYVERHMDRLLGRR